MDTAAKKDAINVVKIANAQDVLDLIGVIAAKYALKIVKEVV